MRRNRWYRRSLFTSSTCLSIARVYRLLIPNTTAHLGNCTVASVQILVLLWALLICWCFRGTTDAFSNVFDTAHFLFLTPQWTFHPTVSCRWVILPAPVDVPLQEPTSYLKPPLSWHFPPTGPHSPVPLQSTGLQTDARSSAALSCLTPLWPVASALTSSSGLSSFQIRNVIHSRSSDGTHSVS